MSGFDTFARWYDGFSDLGYYDDYARFIHRAVSAQSDITVTDILDLGCGTGLLSSRLEKSGYSVIGIDDSAEMLSRARMASETLLLTQQSITDFELYGTVDAIVCSLDGINYITDRQGLSDCFWCVNNYLNPDGVFIFDVNSEYRFREVFAKRDFFVEEKDVSLGWKNVFHEKSGICDFELTLFVKDGNVYHRKKEYQREKLWTDSELNEILSVNGLKTVGVFSDLKMGNVTDKSEKLYYAVKKRKK